MAKKLNVRVRENSTDVLYGKLLMYAEQVHQNNKRRIKNGLISLIVIPFILVGILLLTDSSRIVFLIIWIACMFVAAPVYDPDECGVEEFLDRRRQSEDILGSLMNDELPEVMPAAMTKFSERLLTEENLPELCFGNNCFLLNMKGIEWNDTTEAVLRRLTGKLGMNVILTDAGETVLKNSEKLRQLGVHVMLDLNELHHKKQLRAYLPLIGSGLVCAIGSDWASEAPYRFLRKTKKRMDEAFETVMAASAHLLGK